MVAGGSNSTEKSCVHALGWGVDLYDITDTEQKAVPQLRA